MTVTGTGTTVSAEKIVLLKLAVIVDGPVTVKAQLAVVDVQSPVSATRAVLAPAMAVRFTSAPGAFMTVHADAAQVVVSMVTVPLPVPRICTVTGCKTARSAAWARSS